MRNKKKILLIGGAGFIGTSITAMLRNEQYQIIIADTQVRIEKYATPFADVEYIKLEWPCTKSIRNLAHIDTVVHLYWSTNPNTSMRNIAYDAQSNLIGTIDLLDTLKTSGMKRFIFMSSGGTVYGNSTIPLIPETHPSQPISPYGITKTACESYVQLYALQNGFKGINVRLGNPYGPYQLQGTPTGVIANFIRKAEDNEPIHLYGDGQTIRDFIHVDDVARCIESMINHQTLSGTYNLGSGIGHSVNDIIQLISDLSDRTLDVKYRECRRSDVRSVVLDVSKLKNDLGFSPQVSLETGTQQLLECCQIAKNIAA